MRPNFSYICNPSCRYQFFAYTFHVLPMRFCICGIRPPFYNPQIWTVFMFKTHICNRPNFSIFMENRDKKNFFLSLFLFVKSGCACVENSRGAVKNVQFIADRPTTQPTPRAQDSFIRFKNLIHNTTRTIVSVTQWTLMSVCWLVSIVIISWKGTKVTPPCSFRSTCLIISQWESKDILNYN